MENPVILFLREKIASRIVAVAREQRFFIMCLTFVGLAAQASMAQMPVSSRTRTLGIPHGKDAIVRFFGTAGNMLVCHWDELQGTPVFTCRINPSNPSANRYELVIETTPYGAVNYMVNDMEVVGNRCYFCGKRRYAVGLEYDMWGHLVSVFDSVGFIGTMLLDDITNLPGGKVYYQLCDIQGTSELLRLDAILDPDTQKDTLIGMVGRSVPRGKTCLVTIKIRGSAWAGDIRYASSTDELFSDVVFAADKIVVATHFVNHPYEFALRAGDVNDVFYTTNYSSLDGVYRFNTLPMTCNSRELHPTWHYDDVDIRLSAVPSTSKVVVAYESFSTRPSTPMINYSLTSLYKMDLALPMPTPGITMLDAINVNSLIRSTDVLADLKHVGTTDWTALVQRNKSSSYIASMMQEVSWTPVVDMRSYASGLDDSWTSVDIYNGQQIWVAGNRPNHNDSVVLFYQHIQYPSGSCKERLTPDACRLSPMADKTHENQSLEPTDFLYSNRKWLQINAKMTEIKQTCITYGQ